ncbi:MAG: Ig-like domain-containing protein [Thermoplasmata archaeon]
MNCNKKTIFVTLFVLLAVVAVILLFSAMEVKASTITVDDDGGKDYTSIQGAINASSSGDTVYVYNGTYCEQITINKTINLTGESAQNTIIRGDATPSSKGIYIEHGMNMSTYINISTLKIENFYYGIYIHSSYNNITSNEIVNCYYGIYLQGILSPLGYPPPTVPSEKNKITHNKITNCGFGVYLGDATKLNSVALNSIINSNYSVYIDSNGFGKNLIYSNNMINATLGAYDAIDEYSSNKGSLWNESKRGNYWSDYNGSDLDDDGIGDFPYIISGGSSKDWYPLMRVVDITSISPSINHAPIVMLIVNQSTTVGAKFTYRVNASDEDNDNLTYSSNIGYINNTVFFTFTPTTSGIYNITITANDSKTQTSITFVLNVLNSSPVILSIPAQNVTIGNNFTYQIVATDADNDALAYNASIGTINATGFFSYTPNTTGTYNITITVNDSKTETNIAFVLNVTNLPPVIAITSPFDNSTVNGTITMIGTSSDDVLVQNAQIKIDGGNWIDAVGNTSWNYILNTTALTNGNHTITVRAYDGTYYSPEKSITINVDNKKIEEKPAEPKKEFIPFASFNVIMLNILALAVLIDLTRRKK